MDKIEFAAQAKYQMEKNKITMNQIANELGISVGYVSDIIKGNRQGGEYKHKIAEILGIKDV